MFGYNLIVESLLTSISIIHCVLIQKENKVHFYVTEDVLKKIFLSFNFLLNQSS